MWRTISWGHGRSDHGPSRFGVVFVVSVELAISAESTERALDHLSLDHPSFPKQIEVRALLIGLYNFELPPEAVPNQPARRPLRQRQLLNGEPFQASTGAPIIFRGSDGAA